MLEILRFQNSADVTLGLLLLDGEYLCCTLELPWKNNEINISCIPDGEYTARVIHSKKFDRKVVLLDYVDGRTGIEIHNGNSTNDTLGCILVGDKFAYSFEYMVYNSRRTLEKLIDSLAAYESFAVRFREV